MHETYLYFLFFIVELPPSQLIWWNDKSKLVFEISFRGVIDTVELSESNLFIRVESDYFSIQYLTCKTVVCINNAKFKAGMNISLLNLKLCRKIFVTSALFG